MSEVLDCIENPLMVVHLPSVMKMNDETFEEFCRLNRDLRIEMTAAGELIIMPPTFGRTGNRNAILTALIINWNEQDKTGVVFDSSTLFILPNGAKRSPDVSWVRRSRLTQLTEEQKEKFLPLCPDFVVELRSTSDRLVDLRAKLREYIENGAQLGWLLDPQARHVDVYRADGTVEVLNDAETIEGDSVLPGLTMNLRQIWEADF